MTKTGTFRPNRDTPTYYFSRQLCRGQQAQIADRGLVVHSARRHAARLLQRIRLACAAGCPARYEHFSRQYLRLRYCHLGKYPERIQDRQERGGHRPVRSEKYDVVTLDAANRQALVSDTRVSGRYSEGGPTVSYPQEVKVYGNSFRISDSAAAFFKDMKLKDYITLLFDADGNVAAAYHGARSRLICRAL
ncbi:MAG: hypothetical protein ACLR4Z_06955 [Butyricicoccaceae bacterium]